jgi:hypothetical protein
MIFHRSHPKHHPFPDEWRRIIDDTFVPWRWLGEDERTRLEGLTAELVEKKRWEAAKDFELTTEMQVIIAVHAALLILELDHRSYRKVTSIIVLPTTTVLTGERAGPARGLVTDSPMPIIGQARPHGPLSIACDAAARQVRHPERGHNVIYHEFAHALDMLTGSASGAPLLPTKEERVRWMEVCTAEYRLLQQGEGGHLLDRYGSVNPGEFFAVATELFFDKPVAMQRHKGDLYDVLEGFYRQDPAEREGNRRSG